MNGNDMKNRGFPQEHAVASGDRPRRAEGLYRPGRSGHGVSGQRTQRWVLRLALLIAIALAALAYLLEIDAWRMFQFLIGSLALVLACAIAALLAVVLVKLVKRR